MVNFNFLNFNKPTLKLDKSSVMAVVFAIVMAGIIGLGVVSCSNVNQSVTNIKQNESTQGSVPKIDVPAVNPKVNVPVTIQVQSTGSGTQIHGPVNGTASGSTFQGPVTIGAQPAGKEQKNGCNISGSTITIGDSKNSKIQSSVCGDVTNDK
ncbi:MAG: hypothetical protein QM537_05670 [Candidatus Symbiobacter sp.]|nr:hypothetical protein [Candidatus Symbiobacter sp.]